MLFIAAGYFSTYAFGQGQTPTQPQIEKMSEEEVDEKSVEQAEALADQILSTLAEGGYYEFTEEEATPQLVQGFTEEIQKQQYQQIKSQLGDYQSGLEFKEAYHVEEASQNYTMYRFQSEFDKVTSEVRIIYTSNDQLAGLAVVPWNDQLQ